MITFKTNHIRPNAVLFLVPLAKNLSHTKTCLSPLCMILLTVVDYCQKLFKSSTRLLQIWSNCKNATNMKFFHGVLFYLFLHSICSTKSSKGPSIPEQPNRLNFEQHLDIFMHCNVQIISNHIDGHSKVRHCKELPYLLFQNCVIRDSQFASSTNMKDPTKLKP